MNQADYDNPLFPVMSWKDLHLALEEHASTPVHRAMVRHLLDGLRKQVRYLTPAGLLRELAIITLTVTDELSGETIMSASP